MTATDRYAGVYRDGAWGYDSLVSAEDCEGRLPALIAELAPGLAGTDALDVGAGTGRVTRMLLHAGAKVRAWEIAPAMIAVARERLATEGYRSPTVEFHEGDAYLADFGEGWASLAVAGWCFGHAVSWHPEDWVHRVGEALGEMRRALRPGGVLMVIETLGTGVTEVTPPPGLVEYQQWLETEMGLHRRELRTDYQFASVDEAARVTGAFFGDAMSERVRANDWDRVPEHTGVWWGEKTPHLALALDLL